MENLKESQLTKYIGDLQIRSMGDEANEGEDDHSTENGCEGVTEMTSMLHLWVDSALYIFLKQMNQKYESSHTITSKTASR